MPSAYSCAHCEKTFASELALRGHSRVHASTYEQSRESTRRAAQAKAAFFEERYLAKGKRCLACEKVLPYGTNWTDRVKKYCNHSCAASHLNKARGPRSEEVRKKISEATRATALRKRESRRDEPHIALGFIREQVTSAAVLGPYSRIRYSTCQHCGFQGIYRTARKYCDEHTALYGRNGRYKYAFRFNPFQHPDVFTKEELDWCREVGAYSLQNTKGWTRDHKVSVTEAIRRNLDPYYIKHPLNCEMMTFSRNNKKKGASSISYEDLVAAVDAYDKQKSSILVPPVGIEPTTS